MSREWIPRLPKDWQHTQIRHLARVFAGGTPDRKKPDFWLNGSIPWLNSGAVNQGKITEPSEYVTELAASTGATRWVRKASVVVALAGQGKTKGMAARTEIDTTLNQSLAAIEPGPRLNYRFLHYWLMANYQNLRGLAGGDLRDGLNLDHIGSVHVPLPPTVKQQEVADYLDRETAQIDAMAIDLDQAIVLIDERFQAEVERCFEFLDAPQMPLRSQIQSMTTGTSVTAAKFAPADGEPGVLATSAVFGDELDETAVKSVDPHEYGRLTCPLRVNTLLVSRMNTMNLVGKAVTVDRHLPDVYLPDRLWAVEVDVPRYVYWWTRSQSYRGQIRGLAVGASDSMKTLSQQAFRGITLPVPAIPQQVAVAAQLDEAARLFGALKTELQEAKVLLEERRSALISATVTGQIDVTTQGVSAAERLRDKLEVHV